MNRFCFFERNSYLCTRWWAIVRLVAHHRVFFDAVYSRMWNWVWLPIRNPVFLQSSRLPLYKEKLRILTKLRKNERNAKGKLAFLCISECKGTSAEPKLRKNERNAKGIHLFFASFPLHGERSTFYQMPLLKKIGNGLCVGAWWMCLGIKEHWNVVALWFVQRC